MVHIWVCFLFPHGTHESFKKKSYESDKIKVPVPSVPSVPSVLPSPTFLFSCPWHRFFFIETSVGGKLQWCIETTMHHFRQPMAMPICGGGVEGVDVCLKYLKYLFHILSFLNEKKVKRVRTLFTFFYPLEIFEIFEKSCNNILPPYLTSTYTT